MPYWNAFVANLEMHGSGVFYDPRLNDKAKFPVAARAGFGNVRPAWRRRWHHVAAGGVAVLPAVDSGTRGAGRQLQAARGRIGRALFNGRAGCATCHVPPLFTEPGWAMHTAEEIGIDDFQSSRSPDNRYRTTPLKGGGRASKAATTTTAASRRCSPWSSTTTRLQPAVERDRDERSRGVLEVAMKVSPFCVIGLYR